MTAADDTAGDPPTVQMPWHLGFRAWLGALGRVWERTGSDRLGIIAAGIAFFMMTALFPMLGALGALYAFIADPADLERHLSMLQTITPENAYEIIRGQVQRVAETAPQRLGLGALVGFLIAVWLSRSGVSAAMTGINVAYDEEDRRGIAKAAAVSYLLTLALLGIGMLALIVLVALPLTLDAVAPGSWASAIAAVVRWPIGLAAVMFGIGLLYRYGAERSHPRTPWISVGSAVATVLWIAATWAFSVYVSDFGSYNETYGSLGAAIVLMFWLYIGAFAVLLGAELNAELERATAADTTVGPDRPMGQRGAVVADTVVGGRGQGGQDGERRARDT